MKRYTFPAVVYKDDEEKMFALVINDLKIITDGRTVEEAYEEALVQLRVYLGNSVTFESEIPSASEFENVTKDRPKNVVLLVSEATKL